VISMEIDIANHLVTVFSRKIISFVMSHINFVSSAIKLFRHLTSQILIFCVD